MNLIDKLAKIQCTSEDVQERLNDFIKANSNDKYYPKLLEESIINEIESNAFKADAYHCRNSKMMVKIFTDLNDLLMSVLTTEANIRRISSYFHTFDLVSIINCETNSIAIGYGISVLESNFIPYLPKDVAAAIEEMRIDF